MYEKLSGMTGTADTEAYEFQEIYGLETVVIPPNKPNQRQDRQDQVYKTANEKYLAMLNEGLLRAGTTGLGRYDVHRKFRIAVRHSDQGGIAA